MLLKFIWIYDLLFYILCISTVILLGFALVKCKKVFLASATNMSIIINSESNTLTVTPDRNAIPMSNSDIADYKFEFPFSTTRLQQMNEDFGLELFNNNNNPITGTIADNIIELYIMPLIESSEMESIFLEVFRHFRS